MSVDVARINNTMGKFVYYLSSHKSIAVSVSGGSDSDIIVHIIATYMREYLEKIHFVFCNTGLEFAATKEHLIYLEKRYGIKIERIRGTSVVTAVRQNGVPIISKWHSRIINDYMRGVPWAAQAVEGEYCHMSKHPESKGRFHFTEKQRKLLEEVVRRDMKVSDSCCKLSKKKPMLAYEKSINADLVITGERKAEGGIRASAHKSCFEEGKSGIDKYMPLFFWDDETKAYYKKSEGIRYSDCYEVWGMKRTGCVGCPFDQRLHDDLMLIQYYEPLMYQACMNVFGESYKLMDKFEIRRKQIIDPQISMFD